VPLHLAPNLDHDWRVGDRPGLLYLAALAAEMGEWQACEARRVRRRHVVLFPEIERQLAHGWRER
jgi:hypothetical protein